MQADQGACPHMAALIRSRRELPAVLASFYALGARRNGWLWFGSLAGESEADRADLVAAGLDVSGLEKRGQLTITELDLSVDPAAFVAPWVERVTRALHTGYDALWFSRFPIEPAGTAVADVLPFEAAWMEQFRAGRVVTLCPYIVGGLSDRELHERARIVEHVHDEARILRGGRLVGVGA